MPARPGLVGTIRVFASAVARHYGIPDEIVEDVKLAVSEACTDPIGAGVAGDIDVSIAEDDGDLVCEITSAPWRASAESPADLPEGVDRRVLDRLQVVRALFSDAERSEARGGVTVRFSTASRTTTD